MEKLASMGLYLGAARRTDGGGDPAAIRIPTHLATHGVVVGMTGSGKTGLVTAMVEEALRNGVPVLVVDVKGDLPNLLLGFADVEASSIAPWIEPPEGANAYEMAMAVAEERRRGLGAWGIGLEKLGIIDRDRSCA